MEQDHKNVEIKMLECNWMHCRFIMKNVSVQYANAIRRAIHCEVPSLTFSKIRFLAGNNTVFTEEFLAHRIGLIPIYCHNIDGIDYWYDHAGHINIDGGNVCEVLFTVNVVNNTEDTLIVTDKDIKLKGRENVPIDVKDKDTVCTLTNFLVALTENQSIKDNKKETINFDEELDNIFSDSDDNFAFENENENTPINVEETNNENQKVTGGAKIPCGTKNLDIDFISNRGVNTTYISMRGIPICKLAPGQCLHAEMKALKGKGKIHAKWTPASAVAMKPMVKITIDPFLQDKIAKNDEEAIRWVNDLCPRKIFKIKPDSNGRQQIVVDDTYQECILCDDCVRNRYNKYDEETGKTVMVDRLVSVKQEKDQFYFDVESLGAIGAPEIVMMALNEVKDLIEEISAGNIMANLNDN